MTPEKVPSVQGQDVSVRGPTPHDERYEQILQSIDQGFCIVEVRFSSDGRVEDYRFLEVNRAFMEHTGLQDVMGRWMRDIVPDHEQHWFDIYGHVARTGEPMRFVRMARELGQRWFDVYAFRVGTSEARQVAVLFSDITSRIHSERNAELLAGVSQDLLRAKHIDEVGPLLGSRLAAPIGVSVIGFLEVASPGSGAAVLSSWRAEGARPLPDEIDLGALIPGELWCDAPEGAWSAVPDVEQEPRIVQLDFLREHGLRSVLAVALEQDGRWQHIMLIGRSTTGAWRADTVDLAREAAARAWVRVRGLRAEIELRLSEERLRIVLESAREYAILGTDLDRRITSWNPGAERLLGFSEAEVLGRPADMIFIPEDRAAGVPAGEAATALREGRATNERWHVRKDGTRFWGSGMVMTMRDRGGSVCGLLKIMRDQTAERASRQALERSQLELLHALETTEQARAAAVAAGHAKDEFLAALSHELRTPLNPVLMISSDAAEDETLPAEVRADFDMIRRNVQLEARLIDDILEVSRITQGKLTLRRVRLGLHAAIREAVAMVAGPAEEKDIRLSLALEAEQDRIEGDPARVQQILLNLLNNAVKFTAAGGEVRVETQNSAGRDAITIRIVDTGIGMTSEELARVFQPFTQGAHADTSGSSEFGGLGLGLAIVEELVVRHGGSVRAESPGSGHGAVFTVELPLTGGTASGRPDDSRPSLRGLRVLLVEDHDHTRAALARVLEQRHHEVTVAATCAAALAVARKREFELVITDLALPDGDGYRLFGELRQTHPHLVGIALSGFGTAADQRRSREADFAVHLVKPVPPAKLDQEISRLFTDGASEG